MNQVQLIYTTYRETMQTEVFTSFLHHFQRNDILPVLFQSEFTVSHFHWQCGL